MSAIYKLSPEIFSILGSHLDGPDILSARLACKIFQVHLQAHFCNKYFADRTFTGSEASLESLVRITQHQGYKLCLNSILFAGAPPPYMATSNASDLIVEAFRNLAAISPRRVLSIGIYTNDAKVRLMRAAFVFQIMLEACLQSGLHPYRLILDMSFSDGWEDSFGYWESLMDKSLHKLVSHNNGKLDIDVQWHNTGHRVRYVSDHQELFLESVAISAFRFDRYDQFDQYRQYDGYKFGCIPILLSKAPLGKISVEYCACSVSDLIDLIDRHATTIKHLSLVDMLLSSDGNTKDVDERKVSSEWCIILTALATLELSFCRFENIWLGVEMDNYTLGQPVELKSKDGKEVWEMLLDWRDRLHYGIDRPKKDLTAGTRIGRGNCYDGVNFRTALLG